MLLLLFDDGDGDHDADGDHDDHDDVLHGCPELPSPVSHLYFHRYF